MAAWLYNSKIKIRNLMDDSTTEQEQESFVVAVDRRGRQTQIEELIDHPSVARISQATDRRPVQVGH